MQTTARHSRQSFAGDRPVTGAKCVLVVFTTFDISGAPLLTFTVPIQSGSATGDLLNSVSLSFSDSTAMEWDTASGSDSEGDSLGAGIVSLLYALGLHRATRKFNADLNLNATYTTILCRRHLLALPCNHRLCGLHLRAWPLCCCRQCCQWRCRRQSGHERPTA